MCVWAYVCTYLCMYPCIVSLEYVIAEAAPIHFRVFSLRKTADQTKYLCRIRNIWSSVPPIMTVTLWQWRRQWNRLSSSAPGRLSLLLKLVYTAIPAPGLNSRKPVLTIYHINTISRSQQATMYCSICMFTRTICTYLVYLFYKPYQKCAFSPW